MPEPPSPSTYLPEPLQRDWLPQRPLLQRRGAAAVHHSLPAPPPPPPLEPLLVRFHLIALGRLSSSNSGIHLPGPALCEVSCCAGLAERLARAPARPLARSGCLLG